MKKPTKTTIKNVPGMDVALRQAPTELMTDRRMEATRALGGMQSAKATNDRFKVAYDSGHEDRVNAAIRNEGYVFGHGQWRDEDVIRMRIAKRPILTLNITLGTLLAVFGEYDALTADITTVAKSRGVEDLSGILNQMIQQDLYDNDYREELEPEMFLEGLISRASFLRVTLSTDRDPRGAIKIEPLDNFRVVLAPGTSRYDPDEWTEVYYMSWVTREEMEARYGKAKADAVPAYADSESSSMMEAIRYGHTVSGEAPTRAFMTDDHLEYEEVLVKVCESWRRRECWVFTDETNGDFIVRGADELSKAEAKKIAEENNLTLTSARRKAVWVEEFCGDLMLDAYWSPYDHLTVVPYFPYFYKGRLMALVDNLISPQDQLNKAESQELHIVNSTTNGGWQMEEDSLVNMTPAQLAERGSDSGLVIVRRRGTEPLAKITPNGVPNGISEIGNKALSHFRMISGVNEGMLGLTGANVSGKVVTQKKLSGQAQLRLPFANLRRTQKFIGRAILSIHQKYSTEQEFLVFTSGESEKQAVINMTGADGKITNDITAGRYGVMVVSRPSENSQEDFEFDEALRMKEAGVAMPDWYLVGRSRLRDKEDIVKVMRKAAGLDMSPEEQQIQQLQQQMQIRAMQLELAKAEAEVKEAISKATLNLANANDISNGQNVRKLAELQQLQNSDILNAQLRQTLAREAADTAITKQAMQQRNARDIAGTQLLIQKDMHDSKLALEQDKLAATPEKTEPAEQKTEDK